MRLKFFIVGMMLIFLGIFLETGYTSITGSFIGSRPRGFGFGLVIILCGIPFLLISIRPE